MRVDARDLHSGWKLHAVLIWHMARRAGPKYKAHCLPGAEQGYERRHRFAIHSIVVNGRVNGSLSELRGHGSCGMAYTKRVGIFGGFCTLVAIAGATACSTGNDEPSAPDVGDTSTTEAPSIDSTIQDLKAAHPRANVGVLGNRIRRLYGVAATGKSPEVSAENFRRDSAPSFGIGADELAPITLGAWSKQKSAAAANPPGIGLMYDRTTGKYKFRLFAYEQLRDGIPVFRAGLRTLVREGNQNPVVWANADLRPMGSFRPRAGVVPRAVDVDKSLQALRTGKVLGHASPAPASLTHVSAPTLTIFAGMGGHDVAPRTAMQYTARDAAGVGKWTFVADVETGDILHVESNVHYDVNGSVQARVNVGDASMDCDALGNVPLPHAEVTSSAGNAFTNGAGAFTIVQSGSGTVNVVSSVTGQYVDVTNGAGNTTSLSLSVTPPGPANFLHQDTATPPELVLAQLNAYKQVNELRDLLLTHLPDYPVIATQTNFPVSVNQTGFDCDRSGGAWYDNDSVIRSISFCQRTAERANTAFRSIVHHEYGHHIVDSGGSLQAEYGEGMADTIAMLFTKDPRIGLGYELDCNEPLRNAATTCQYSPTECSSCGSGIYECGGLISGIVWDIWQELDITEPANSDAILRSLVFSSVPLHTGTSIDPSIAIDYLTLDDDDELLENGTPHYVEICAGFGAHGMECPPIVDGLVVKGADLDAEGPSDGPFEPGSVSYTLHNLGPQQSIAYSVTTSAPWLTVDSAGGTIALGGQTTVTISINQAEAALLDDGDYTATINFVNETSGVGTVSREAKLRVGAPVPVYTATFSSGAEGYTIDTEPSNLWHRSVACVDTLPGHSAGGFLYYGREDNCSYATGTPILHTMTSPPIAIADPTMAGLGFNYLLWTENDPNYDDADISISVNGGPFQLVASNNNGAVKLEETDEWAPMRFDIFQLLPATGPTSIRIQLAFNAWDPENNVRTGFAVDDITVYAQAVSCESDSACNDGLVCNGVEACVNQVCVAGTPLNCDDGNVCTSDACDDVTGCSHANNTDPCADDGDECTNDVCSAGSCTHPDNGTCSPTGAFLEVNGRVVMEAEHFADNTPRSAHSWDLTSNAQASGQSLMKANPNSGVFINANFANTSPELSYPVKFSTTGTYYVWVRGIGPTANDDSCHVGMNGTEIASADRITGFTSSLSWTRNTIDGAPATLQVTQAGVRDINVWMREDGLSFDKIVLSRNANYVPFGAGPPESEREGPTQSPCAAFCANPVTFTALNYQSGNLGTAATCHETMGPLNGGVCGNFVNPRQLLVNGVPMNCNWTPWPSIPAAQNGGYCFQTTSGNHPWAAFATW
jgi:hypothetical protein